MKDEPTSYLGYQSKLPEHQFQRPTNLWIIYEITNWLGFIGEDRRILQSVSMGIYTCWFNRRINFSTGTVFLKPSQHSHLNEQRATTEKKNISNAKYFSFGKKTRRNDCIYIFCALLYDTIKEHWNACARAENRNEKKKKKRKSPRRTWSSSLFQLI